MATADDLFSLLAAPAPKRLPVVGNRMSVLPLAEFCPKAGPLGQRYGAGRAAAMSTYFHARCAGLKPTVRLTADEHNEVETWVRPKEVALPDGTVLPYEAAEKEVEVYLDENGTGCPAAQAASTGHLDFAWTHERIAYVVDIKKELWTASGPDSLQLLAYGEAYSQPNEACDGYVTGLYIATSGEWIWDTEITMRESRRADLIRERLAFALRNTEGDACTGPHCRNCWSRFHCPDHLLPALASETYLAPLAEGRAHDLDHETAGRLKLAIGRLKDLYEVADDNLKEWCRRNGPITHQGKRLELSQVRGRESVSVAGLREALGADAEKYITRGPAFEQWGRKWK